MFYFFAGVAHGDELIYLYYFPFGNGPEETVLSNRMLDVWTNFAKYGYISSSIPSYELNYLK